MSMDNQKQIQRKEKSVSIKTCVLDGCCISVMVVHIRLPHAVLYMLLFIASSVPYVSIDIN